MRIQYQIAAACSAVVGIAGIVFYQYNYRMPLKDYTRYALYMAVLDDEICRNELEGNCIGGKEIIFPEKSTSLQYRYHLFLQTNRKKSRKNILHEISKMERRLVASKKYMHQKKVDLDIVHVSQKRE